MELYERTCYKLTKTLTSRYSTSFYLSSLLFPWKTRKHIYAIYSMVRIADEVVDSYHGTDAEKILTNFEKDVYRSLGQSFSTNPVLHAFAKTSQVYEINETLIAPFFESMRSDLWKKNFTKEEYTRYIHGSAEVVGLMCLKIFSESDKSVYTELETGARALASAYQKVNFLRDFRADFTELGRVYFPNISYEKFDTNKKQTIEQDIAKDFAVAKHAINKLPKNARRAVRASYFYYYALFEKLKRASPEQIMNSRVRVSNAKKILLLFKAWA